MKRETRKDHWETIYETNNPDQVSWTQDVPQTSLDLITAFTMSKKERIIDVGGGDSKLVDHLLDLGYENITVLDISAKALEKAQKRLGDQAWKVKWIVSDIATFEPDDNFDVWHDRAAFHFLTRPNQIVKYMDTAEKSVKGYMIIGLFSENGPTKCSGLDVKQYNENTLTATFRSGFEKVKCTTEEHTTPLGSKQHFLFCSFKKK